MKHVDVVIIGGSLAGAACARELARQGIDAIAFDRDRFPREKVCGGFVSPGAVDLLDELEVLEAVKAAGATQVRSSRIRIGGREIPVELPRHGLGISRRTLDAVMADHAAVQQGFVRDVKRAGEEFRVQLEEREVSARVVVDAAGKLSRFSRRRAVPQFGVQFYETETRGEVLDFWFFEDGYGGAVTVEGGRTNACFLVDKDALVGFVGAWGNPSDLRQPGNLGQPGHPRDLGDPGHPGDLGHPGALGSLRRSSSGEPESQASGFCPPESGGQRGPIGSREGRFLSGRCEHASLEPPPVQARSLLHKPEYLVTGPLAFDTLSSDFISIGDAAGMVDPFCGEGMRHALETGMLAATIIADGLNRGDSYATMRAGYTQQSERRWRGKRTLGKIIRHMLKHPRVTSIALGLNPEYWFRKLWD